MDPLHWEYLAEGNRNVVLSASPGAPVRFKGLVLRIPKEAAQGATQGSTGQSVTSHGPGMPRTSRNTPSQNASLPVFVAAFIAPLLPQSATAPLARRTASVTLSRSFLADVADAVTNSPARPSHRAIVPLPFASSQSVPPITDSSMGGACATDSFIAFLIPDLTKHFNSPSFSLAVELKPKSPLSPLPNAHRCSFCAHQRLKHAAGSIRVISPYCPMDLYSNSVPRIRKSIGDLYSNWENDLGHGLQNNFRLFLDGAPIHEPMHIPIPVPALQDILTEILVKSPLLPQLKSAINKLSHRTVDIIPLVPPSLRDDFWFNEALNNMDHVYKIREYLLSATLRDASIIITLSPCLESAPSPYPLSEDQALLVTESGTWRYTIHIVDLDPKSIEKIPKYRVQELEIARFAGGPDTEEILEGEGCVV